MTIKQGSTVKVTYSYSEHTGVIGVVEQVPDGYSELYLIRMPNGAEVWLFDEEFEPYTPPINLLKEKIETKIEEYREVTIADATYELGIIQGLQLALDILSEEE